MSGLVCLGLWPRNQWAACRIGVQNAAVSTLLQARTANGPVRPSLVCRWMGCGPMVVRAGRDTAATGDASGLGQLRVEAYLLYPWCFLGSVGKSS